MAETSEAPKLEDLTADPDTFAAVDKLLECRPDSRPVYVPLNDPYNPEPTIEAEATIAHGWDAGELGKRILLRTPVEWDAIAEGHRSRTLALNSWDPMAAALAAYSQTGIVDYLRWCLDLALDWAKQHASLEVTSEFGWYDMAVGTRGVRLAYLLAAGLHSGVLSRDELNVLVASGRLHLRALEPEEHFAAHSNHGIYQAAGQLALASALPAIPESRPARDQGATRLEELMHHHFDEDGVHHEHSPGYHLMVLRSMLALRALGLIRDGALLERLRTAEEAMSWFIAPIGTVPSVGDSDWLNRLQVADDANLRDPALRFALTWGAEGAAPQDLFRVFTSAGYVVARDAWPAGEKFERSSYLLQACGFHSRVHKHADDLSLVWYARGLDLLTDAGRYGYPKRMDPATPLGQLGFYYDDPNRIYVESTRAHNCLEIDRGSYPRRGVPFYGSAIRSASRDPRSGVVVTEAAAVHFETVEHTRLLLHRPGEWTLVVDHARDRQGRPHTFAQRFQFGPELELVRSEPRSLLFRLPTTGEYLDVVALVEAEGLPLLRGQTDPELQGFVSRVPGQLIPSWSAGWEVEGVTTTVLACLFAIVPTPRLSVTRAELSDDGTGGEVRWTAGGQACALGWSRPDEGRIDCVYQEL